MQKEKEKMLSVIEGYFDGSTSKMYKDAIKILIAEGKNPVTSLPTKNQQQNKELLEVVFDILDHCEVLAKIYEAEILTKNNIPFEGDNLKTRHRKFLRQIA